MSFICDQKKTDLLAITDVTRLSLTSLTTDHGQASLSPPLPEVFVISNKTRSFFVLHLSLDIFLFFSHVIVHQSSLV